jgi:AcrR family transcriptional regulator
MVKAQDSQKTNVPNDPRAKIVDALMILAAERSFEDISISAICTEAKVSLADFRDAFPSKGAILAGFSKRIDRVVLSHVDEGSTAESPKERLFDVLMRRLEAVAPYRAGLKETTAWLRRDPAAAVAMNSVIVNAMRFMLEAAGIETEGVTGAVKLQGLALAWRRIIAIWLDDDDAGLSKTMAALDRELTRGEQAVANLDRLDQFASPLKALARAAFDARTSAGRVFRHRDRADRGRSDD